MKRSFPLIFLLMIFICFSCQKDNDGIELITEISEIVGQSGGTIEVTDPSSPLFGVKILIPQDALDGDTTITIKQSAFKPQVPDNAVKVSNVYHLGTDSLLFNFPVFVTIPYDGDEVTDETELFVFTWDGSSWEGVSLINRNPDKNLITVQTRHFSDFVVLELIATQSTGIIDTYFRPDIDGFQNNNSGSIFGDCFGMVCFTKWYYENKKTSNNNLKSRYNLTRDIEIANDAQTVLLIENYILNRFSASQTDESVSEMLIHFLETGPQVLSLTNDNLTTPHAVLVYKYDFDLGLFYVYDPNDPEGEHTIEYKDGNLEDYQVYTKYTVLSSCLYNDKTMNCVFYAGTWEQVLINVTDGVEHNPPVISNVRINPGRNGNISCSLGPVYYYGSINNNQSAMISTNDYWWWINGAGDLNHCSSGYTSMHITFSSDKNGSGPYQANSCDPMNSFSKGNLICSR